MGDSKDEVEGYGGLGLEAEEPVVRRCSILHCDKV